MQRYFIHISYNGTHYCGWQTQPNGITVQEVLDAKLSALLRVPTATVGAGRTDTGVHATQLYAHFDSAPRHVDDDDKRVSPNSIRTIDSPDSSSSSDGGSSESSQSNNKSRKRSRSPSHDRRGNFEKPPSQRSDNNRDTPSRYGNNGER